MKASVKKYLVCATFAIFIVFVALACVLLPSFAYGKTPLRISTGKHMGSNAFLYNYSEYYNPASYSQENDDQVQDENNDRNQICDFFEEVANWLNGLLNAQPANTDDEQTVEDAATQNSEQDTSNQQQAALPARYLLTSDKVTATDLKEQGCMGTCWAFGAIAAAESSIVNDGLAPANVDLSERHLAWFEHSLIGATAQGYNIVCADGSSATDTASWRVVNLGGFATSAYKLFATGQGPVLESSAPYNSSATTVGSAAYTGDWSLPESERFTTAGVELVDGNILPAIYYDKHGTSAVGINATKAEIAAGRAVSTAIYNQTTVSSASHDSAYSTSGHAYVYTYEEKPGNHEVAIVGYDDSIAAATFTIDGNVPAGNGAFLIKDSTGSNFGVHADGTPRTDDEVAAGTNGGYYWVSYYDHTLTEQISFKFKAASGLSQHAYDFIGNCTNYIQSLVCTKNEPPVGVANVYSADTNQEVREVGIESLGTADSVTVQVRLIADDASDEHVDADEDTDSSQNNDAENSTDDENTLTIEESNLLRGSKVISTKSNMKFSSGGYHRVALDDPAIIPAGRKYAVIVTHAIGSSNYVLPYTVANRAVDSDDSGYRLNGATLTCAANVARGQSLIVQGDDASDIVDVASNLDEKYTYQNFLINAYTAQTTQEAVDAAYPAATEFEVPLTSVVTIIVTLVVAVCVVVIIIRKEKRKSI